MDAAAWYKKYLEHIPLEADPRPNTKALRETTLSRLNIEMLEVAHELVVMRMPTPGLGDAGLLLVIAESAASTAAGFMLNENQRAFGAELNCSLPQEWQTEGYVYCRATPNKIGDKTHLWNIEICGDNGDLLLTGRCTLGIVTL